MRLDRPDAQRLVDALWDASATSGAVVAIGKIRHRLRGSELVVQLSDDEVVAIRTALSRTRDLTPALQRLREALA